MYTNQNDAIDLPVFLIFFNRPDSFSKVFEVVRKIKPSKLFLACDGPRLNNVTDEINIAKCKKIAENIDWECEVYQNYSKENLGCGMRMYSGVKWAFEYVDRLVVLEDDCVPSPDFFPFCQELLEKYKDDDRVFMISAMNHLGKYEKTPNSYFFAGACCWGWATWKRSWDKMDYEMTFLDDTYSMSCVEKKYPYYKNAYQDGIERKKILDSGKRLSAWTYQAGMASVLQDQYSIIPSVNLITNIGLTSDSTHATDDVRKLPRKIQQYFNAPMFKMEFPLKHPKYIIEDRIYYKEVQKKFKMNFFDLLEGFFRKIIYAQKGDFKLYFSKLKKKTIKS